MKQSLRFRRRFVLAGLVTILLSNDICRSNPMASPAPATQPVPISTGKTIEQVPADQTANIGSMPMNVIISPDGKYAITTGNGYHSLLCSIAISDGTKRGELVFDTDAGSRTKGLYYGITFGPDGRIYASEGNDETIAVASLSANGELKLEKPIKTGDGSFPAGIAADAAGHLYTTNNDPVGADKWFDAPASMDIFDSAGGKHLGRYTFKDDLGLSDFPLPILVSRDGSRAYIGSERDDCVYVLDTSNPSNITLHSQLSTGEHPIALLLSKSQSKLFVANAQSDTISIVDTVSEKITATVVVRPDIAKELAGATPTGLALSTDEQTLYATLGDMNAVAVISLANENAPAVKGFISTGWYPTSVVVLGDQLLITNAKGDKSRVPHDFTTGTNVRSPLYLLQGTLWRIPVESDSELATATAKCLEDCRLTPRYLNNVNPLLSVSLQSGKIKHIIYIVKENRTYDQVLGDVPQGNGDITRCLFPREVTPNQHALAERFVLLDNFYDSGEVSGDGWTWSTQAQANEYTIRNVPYQYSKRGRTYDYEGVNKYYPTGGFPATDADGQPTSDDPKFKNGGKSINDVAASPGGHLWDMALKHQLSYRNYGFFLTGGDPVPAGNGIEIPDNFPSVASLQPAGHDLKGVTDIDYRKFDLTYADSDAPSRIAVQTPTLQWTTPTYGKAGAVCRYAEWNREFALMLAKDPTGESIPNLMTVRLGNDHTSGMSGGKPSPRAMVADNDYAIGELVDAISHSPIWTSTAIVIVEDDAQNGSDHVDNHRSTCYVVSPWIKKSSVDHSFQCSVSALRTIECLLNLPAMCQYDAASDVINDWDTSPSNSEPYAAIQPATAILSERGRGRAVGDEGPEQSRPVTRPSTRPVQPPQGGASAPSLENPQFTSVEDLVRLSDLMDFSRADQAPADLLNQIIWKSVKGVDSAMPPTPSRPGPARAPKDKKDKDDDGD